MGVKDKRRYVCGGFPPVGNFYIQQDSYLICDDMVEELATIPTSMLKQKMRNIQKNITQKNKRRNRNEHI